ncbi:hypothetical protein [Actinoallomurus iriomotensis]|uniref:Uncharacterized protein n=1 Tax=Actinoallomurus iriomotensis TaxID=478107 RepID=A0A9W6S148_9ACTN|nr:hypothetical protein [Actinoallomurus iriomotensis]GLY86055.1 hypothetical protein Airi02_039840 [Actinoallomurus iriomotensis]
MADFNQTLLTHHDQAVEAAKRAGQRLTRLLETDEPNLAAAIAETLQRRAYARWWTTLIDHIEDGGTDPATALTDARTTAHDALLTLPIPRSACPYATAEAITVVEATRAFFHDTATLMTSPRRPE